MKLTKPDLYNTLFQKVVALERLANTKCFDIETLSKVISNKKKYSVIICLLCLTKNEIYLLISFPFLKIK